MYLRDGERMADHVNATRKIVEVLQKYSVVLPKEGQDGELRPAS